MKLESHISRTLVRRLRIALPNAVVFKHNDASTAGIPDISVTYKRRTLWLEVKRGHHFNDRTSQHVTMLRLGAVGMAYYVLYGNSTVIVRPDGSPVVASPQPLDHDFVISFVEHHDTAKMTASIKVSNYTEPI